MVTFYLILVVILFILAISDLVVGVSNDAVNFLNSAIGAKVSGFKTILFVAALGIIAGATFSSGMMEVARKGIFHPELFYFSEIIILFLAVMLSDVILLDTFNTYGFPTSTTVSIVFELLGAAVGLALVKTLSDPDSLAITQYINSSKALAIIFGILLSIFIAFTMGVIIQFLSRLLFSFNFKRRIKYFGSVWGGFAITSIIYFILVKGASGASFMTQGAIQYITDHTLGIILITFLGCSAILQICQIFFKLNILKVIIMVGTFALAMAFASNDLVNFIGVPLAGYHSFQIFLESQATNPGAFSMDGLAGQVSTPTYMLLIAGIIMVITLWTSKKARSVVQTSIDLGRQEEGNERFASYMLSRNIVRNFAAMAQAVNRSLPGNWARFTARQFDQTPFKEEQAKFGKSAPAFDMLRASVTLVVASILIAIGTNLKLPLSTTYVTFMVFMGTSLADGAWGRDSAVYRVSGVISVVGGWFVTALFAFTMAFVLVLVFHFFGLAGIILVILIAGYFLVRTHIYHKNMSAEKDEIDSSAAAKQIDSQAITELILSRMKDIFEGLDKTIESAIAGLRDEDLKVLNKSRKNHKKLKKNVGRLRNQVTDILNDIEDDHLDSAHLFIIVVDHLQEMTQIVEKIVGMNLFHVDNHHKPLLSDQVDELLAVQQSIKNRFDKILEIYRNRDLKLAEEFTGEFSNFIALVRKMRKNQIKRIKAHKVGTRNSQLYFNHIGEQTRLNVHSQRLVSEFYDLILSAGES